MLTIPHASVQHTPHICPASKASTTSSLKASDIPEWYQTIRLCATAGKQARRKRAVFNVSACKLQYNRNGEIFASIHSWCRRDKNSVSSLPLEPCFDVPNDSPNHLLNSLFLCLEKLAKKSSNQTTHLFSCQNSL